MTEAPSRRRRRMCRGRAPSASPRPASTRGCPSSTRPLRVAESPAGQRSEGLHLRGVEIGDEMVQPVSDYWGGRVWMRLQRHPNPVYPPMPIAAIFVAMTDSFMPCESCIISNS